MCRWDHLGPVSYCGVIFLSHVSYVLHANSDWILNKNQGQTFQVIFGREISTFNSFSSERSSVDVSEFSGRQIWRIYLIILIWKLEERTNSTFFDRKLVEESSLQLGEIKMQIQKHLGLRRAKRSDALRCLKIIFECDLHSLKLDFQCWREEDSRITRFTSILFEVNMLWIRSKCFYWEDDSGRFYSPNSFALIGAMDS